MNSLINDLITWAKDLNVLYVEDDATLRDELSLLLSDIFARVDLAENGQEGLAKIETNSYDIVITDIRMPVMNGIEMIENIKKRYKNLPIIVISAHNESEYLLELINQRVENFLTKPIRSEQVFDVLHKVTMHITNQKKVKKYKKDLEIANFKLKKLVNVQSKNLDFQESVLSSYKNAIYEVAIVSMLDSELKIKDINENFSNSLGFSKDEVIGVKYSSFAHPDENETLFSDIVEKITNKKTWVGMFTYQAKTLQPIYYYTMVIPILDNKDEVYEFLVVNQDLTKFEELNKKRLLESVEESQSIKYDELLHTLPFPSIVFDKNAKITYYNKSFEGFVFELDNQEFYNQLLSGDIYVDKVLNPKEAFSIYDSDFKDMLGEITETINLESTVKTSRGEKKFFIKVKKLAEDLYISCLIDIEDFEYAS